MVTDFGNLAKRANEARGTSLADAFPEFKPFVPPGTPEELLQYQQKYVKYGAPHPNKIGDNIRQGILNAQLQGDSINDDLFSRPMANFGLQGFDSLKTLPLPFDIKGATAVYVRPGTTAEGVKRQPIIYDTLKILGETERFIDDFMIVTPRSTRGDVKHELTHRAFSKLRELYKDYKGYPGSSASFSSFNKLGFDEEDVNKLLDYTNNENSKHVEWYFKDSKRWKRKGSTTAEELIQKPEVLEFLMAIQQLAVEELKKQGIDTGRPRIPFAPIPELFADVLK